MNRLTIFAAGIAATLVAGALWHGPLGAGEALAARADTLARVRLDRDEMFAISARLQRRPLARVMVLSGPADAFQRSELVRRINEIPGVSEVRWNPASLPQEGGRS